MVWGPQGALVHRVGNAQGSATMSLSGSIRNQPTGLVLEACYASEDGTRFGPTVTAR